MAFEVMGVVVAGDGDVCDGRADVVVREDAFVDLRLKCVDLSGEIALEVARVEDPAAGDGEVHAVGVGGADLAVLVRDRGFDP